MTFVRGTNDFVIAYMWTKFLVMQSAAQKPDADFSLEKLEKLHADIS